MSDIAAAAAPAPSAARVPTATLRDTLGALAEVVLPTVAKGVILRRPRVMRAAGALDLDRRAVRRMQALRERYGEGPVLLAIPFRRQAILLSGEDVRRVLAETPHPFSPATAEKRAALGHFEPEVSLVSEGGDRALRKRLNDTALEARSEVHGCAARFGAAVAKEMAGLLAEARAEGGRFGWDAFNRHWHRAVRRIVLGDAARDDRALTDALAKLRGAANWAFLRPRRRALRERFHARVAEHLRRAEAGSLAGLVAAGRWGEGASPTHQIAHYLFAFEPAGIATFRALALLAAHPEAMSRARAEAEGGAPGERLPFLRSCVLESLRLYPTTPAILRETREETRWRNGALPKGAGVVIFAPFFHRDGARLPDADRFRPEAWLEGARPRDWPIVPFSAGDGLCPAHHLVPLLGAAALAALLPRAGYAVEGGALPPDDAAAELPGTLDHAGLGLRLLA